jgi:Asp/Glu/hydantoin racemase
VTAAARSTLTLLADAAAARSGGRAVAVIRSFDRTSRLRAADLRGKLARRGVVAVDVTPLVLNLRHTDSDAARLLLHSESIGLVVDAAAGSSNAAASLAHELGVPTLDSTADWPQPEAAT